MSFSRFLGMVLLSGILFSCASNKLEVTTDYSWTDYSDTQTYSWYSGQAERNPTVTELGHERIKASINDELLARGFTELETDAALFVNYSVVAQAKVNVNEYQVYDGYAPGFSWDRDHGAVWNKTREEYTERQVEEYFEGSLVIDVLDAETNKIVWRGVGRQRLSQGMSRDQRDQLIKEVVGKILAKFPPQ